MKYITLCDFGNGLFNGALLKHKNVWSYSFFKFDLLFRILTSKTPIKFHTFSKRNQFYSAVYKSRY